jgi:hypothetical protein
MRAVLVLALTATLAACAGNPAQEEPAWAAESQGFPNLREVPTGSSATTDASHWQGIERELLAARDQAQANPRAQAPETPENPAAFVEEARRELAATRDSHAPY